MANRKMCAYRLVAEKDTIMSGKDTHTHTNETRSKGGRGVYNTEQPFTIPHAVVRMKTPRLRSSNGKRMEQMRSEHGQHTPLF